MVGVLLTEDIITEEKGAIHGNGSMKMGKNEPMILENGESHSTSNSDQENRNNENKRKKRVSRGAIIMFIFWRCI